MKAISYNQRKGRHKKALCPGPPQGLAWCHLGMGVDMGVSVRLLTWWAFVYNLSQNFHYPFAMNF